MKTLTALVILIMSLTVLPAQHNMSHAQGRHQGRGGKDRTERMDRQHHDRSVYRYQHGIHQELGLSEEQKTTIENLRMQHRLAAIDIQAEIKKLSLQRRNHLSKGEFRQAKRLTEQYYNKRKELAQKRIELTENIYNQLDDEQKERFLKQRNSERSRGMKRR